MVYVYDSGNGFPGVGDEVLAIADDMDHRLMRVANCGSIETGPPGQPDRVVVELVESERAFDELDEVGAAVAWDTLPHVPIADLDGYTRSAPRPARRAGPRPAQEDARGRMTLTTDEQGRVTLSYDEEWCGETRRVNRTFLCREDGGYVWEWDEAGNRRQPCDRLASTGSTLYCASRDLLPALIRREYRAMRRAERAEATA